MHHLRLFVVVFGFAACALRVEAQKAPEIEPLQSVHSATAIAIRPSGNRERHELYVADDEAGSVVRISSDALDQPREVITGFGQGKAPIALLFIGGRSLMIALPGDPPKLQGYEIPEDGKPLAVDQPKHSLRVAEDIRGTATGITIGSLALLVVGFNDDGGWVLRSRLRSGVPGDLKPFLKVGTRPTCAAISTRGWVVVGDAGQRDGGDNSRLTFHNPSDAEAETALAIEPGLLDVSAIAYSPQGSMYVADVAEADPQRSGIYRIDMAFSNNNIGGKAVRVLAIEHPTALTFAPDRTLYMIARDKELFRVTNFE